MCNSQLWLRSESACIPRKVFSVQKSDETSYPIMYSQSQDMLLLSHGGLPQSQYIYGNPPWKTPWLGKLYHCWVKTTGSLLFGADTWSDPQSVSWGWRTEVWSHEVICAGHCSQECCPSPVSSPGAFLLVCWDAALLWSGGSWHPGWIPSGWISFHHLLCVQYKQYYFLDVPSY